MDERFRHLPKVELENAGEIVNQLIAERDVLAERGSEVEAAEQIHAARSVPG